MECKLALFSISVSVSILFSNPLIFERKRKSTRTIGTIDYLFMDFDMVVIKIYWIVQM